MDDPAPEGPPDFAGLTVSLKRYSDTNLRSRAVAPTRELPRDGLPANLSTYQSSGSLPETGQAPSLQWFSDGSSAGCLEDTFAAVGQ
jgi:hypothetical protein